MVSGYSPDEFTTPFLLLRHTTVLQSEFFCCVSYTRNQTDKIMLSCFILFFLGFVTFWKTVALLGISLKVSSIYNEYREKHNKPFLADIFTIFISVLNRGLKCFFKGKKPAYLTTFCMSNEH